MLGSETTSTAGRGSHQEAREAMVAQRRRWRHGSSAISCLRRTWRQLLAIDHCEVAEAKLRLAEGLRLCGLLQHVAQRRGGNIELVQVGEPGQSPIGDALLHGLHWRRHLVARLLRHLCTAGAETERAAPPQNFRVSFSAGGGDDKGGPGHPAALNSPRRARLAACTTMRCWWPRATARSHRRVKSWTCCSHSTRTQASAQLFGSSLPRQPFAGVVLGTSCARSYRCVAG